jgi:hypothetical protein
MSFIKSSVRGGFRSSIWEISTLAVSGLWSMKDENKSTWSPVLIPCSRGEGFCNPAIADCGSLSVTEGRSVCRDLRSQLIKSFPLRAWRL